MKRLTRNLALTLFLLFLGTLVGMSQDWPQWRGINRDGQVKGFKAPQSWPQQFTQAWKVTVGLGDATPALVNNRIYAFGKQGDKEVLQCLDASNGKQLWQSEGYPSAPTTGPASSHPGPRSSVSVSDGKVVTVGVWGDVACFDASTGKLLWRNEDYKGKIPRFFTGMSPLIENGICYTHLGGPQTGSYVAFELSTGAIKWKVDGEGPTYGSPILMTIDGLKQLVFQSPTKLVSFNLPDGKILWEYATPSGEGRVISTSSPIIDNNKIYLTGLNNGFSAVEVKKSGNAYTVNKLWTNPDWTTSYSTALYKDGFLYGFTEAGRLFCINASNGQTAWKDESPFNEFGSLLNVGASVIFVSNNSRFVVLKPDGQKFNPIAQIKLNETGIFAHPILSGSNILIKDNESLILYSTK